MTERLQAIGESYQNDEIVVLADRAKVQAARQERYNAMTQDLRGQGVWPLAVPKESMPGPVADSRSLTRAMRMNWGGSDTSAAIMQRSMLFPQSAKDRPRPAASSVAANSNAGWSYAASQLAAGGSVIVNHFRLVPLFC
jgi:hypothetical protein